MYWPLLNMYSENFGFGQEVFSVRGTFINRKRGLHAVQRVYEDSSLGAPVVSMLHRGCSVLPVMWV